eukprot:6435398-Prymnesium_polylepis.2
MTADGIHTEDAPTRTQMGDFVGRRRLDIFVGPLQCDLRKPASHLASRRVPLRGVRGKLTENKHCTVLSRFHFKLVCQVVQLETKHFPATVVVEIASPLRPRLRIFGELAQVIERLLQQLAHRRIVKRQASLS